MYILFNSYIDLISIFFLEISKSLIVEKIEKIEIKILLRVR